MENSLSQFVTLSRGTQGGLMNTIVELPNNQMKSFNYDIPYEVISYREGELIFQEGDVPKGLFLLKSGCVKLVVNREHPRGRTTTPEYVTKLVSVGEVFGYKSLSKGTNYKVHATAIKSSIVWLYPKDAIMKALSNVHPLVRNMLDQSVHDLESFESTSQLHYLASVQERIAHQMLSLADRFGVQTANGVSLNLKLTRNEFAQLASTINESLSRHLTEFKNEKIIELNGKEIIILDREALVRKSGNLHH